MSDFGASAQTNAAVAGSPRSPPQPPGMIGVGGSAGGSITTGVSLRASSSVTGGVVRPGGGPGGPIMGSLARIAGGVTKVTTRLGSLSNSSPGRYGVDIA